MSRPSRPESNDPRDIAVWVGASLEDLRDELIRHIDKRHDEQLTMFKTAFTDHDIHKHKAWHEAREAQEADGRELRRSVVRWGAVGALGAGLSFNWNALVAAIKDAFK